MKIRWSAVLIGVDIVIALAAVGALTNAGALFGGKAAWYVARAAGITAYLLLAASSALGLLTSSRLLMRWIALPQISEAHKFVSWVGLGATALHGGVLLADRSFDFGLLSIALPFMSPYRPVAVAAGILGGYLSLLLVWSFYVRQRTGQAAWRAFHYSAFLAYALATVHGLLAGSDTRYAWVQAIYLGSSAAVLFLVFVRMLGGRYVPARRDPPSRRAVAAPAKAEPSKPASSLPQ